MLKSPVLEENGGKLFTFYTRAFDTSGQQTVPVERILRSPQALRPLCWEQSDCENSSDFLGVRQDRGGGVERRMRRRQGRRRRERERREETGPEGRLWSLRIV